MSESPEKSTELPIGELKEVTLRIPGEYFFCDTVALPSTIETEKIADFAEFILNESGVSPYPAEQLAWGYFADEEKGNLFIFATPLAKLRQAGWQNLEVFRRVFPSFVSLFASDYAEPTIAFLLHEETLTAAAFQEETPVPDFLYSVSLNPEEGEEALDDARGKLLALFNLEDYQISKDILVAHEVSRTKDGFFRFEHEWFKGTDSDLSLDQDVLVSADELWTSDLRTRGFKEFEQKRRNQARARWKGMLIWSIGMAAVLLVFAGIKIAGVRLQDKQNLSQQMAAEVPLVIESQKLLEKLRQNKLGGIDPFGAIVRMANQRTGSDDDSDVTFTHAYFESRNEVKLEGEGKTIEAINTFIENLEKNQIASIRIGRSGDEKRKIESDGDKTTFTIEFNLIEQDLPSPVSVQMEETPPANETPL